MRHFVPDFRMIMNKREYIQANKDWLEGNHEKTLIYMFLFLY